MDLTTTYMGLKLKNPLVPSASTLSEKIDNLRKMEDSGAAAVVCYSLFEEEIIQESRELNDRLNQGTESFFEATSYFPEPDKLLIGPDFYLEHIRKAKAAVGIPIIGSLNGCSEGGWVQYAKLIQDAGAVALELNIYFMSTDAASQSEQIERVYLEILKAVKAQVTIPVAVKLSPFFSAMASMAKRLEQAGADGLVLFNRFYQPDIDLEALEVVPNVLLSTPQALRLPLRWIGILNGRVGISLAATSGIHNADDVLKLIMAGADVTMLCSALFQKGVGHLTTVLNEMTRWMEEHEYESIKQMKGSLSQRSSANPAAFERANYMKALRTFRG
ncbi:MAG: dihydroorotate dehydrogenase-like protein [Acidobacteria bacterium]|nr:MAG: dihydroorotate dehydrogenase-like protein [Acidobacteriota bacterium]